MLRHLMTSWHLNIWKVEIWLPQEGKELSKWNKKYFPFFHNCSLLDIKQNGKNKADTTLKYIDGICAKIVFKWDPETNLNQSLHKVSSEAALRRCSSKQMYLNILRRCFPLNIAKFFRTAFYIENLQRLLFFSFIK